MLTCLQICFDFDISRHGHPYWGPRANNPTIKRLPQEESIPLDQDNLLILTGSIWFPMFDSAARAWQYPVCSHPRGTAHYWDKPRQRLFPHEAAHTSTRIESQSQGRVIIQMTNCHCSTLSFLAAYRTEKDYPHLPFPICIPSQPPLNVASRSLKKG
jgi:hypothetical protein